MRTSYPFIVVVASLFVIAIVLWVFVNRTPPDVSLSATKDIDRAISEKEAELKALTDRSPEEEAESAALREVLSATRATRDVTPPGVRIETTSKEKVIINENEGYRITLPARLVLARSIESNHLEFHDAAIMCQGDPSCPPVLRIDIAGKNQTRLPLENWLSAAEVTAGESLYSPRESLTINGASVVRVTTLLPEIFDGYDYYFAHGDTIYVLQIARVYHDTYKDAIYSLRVTTP